MARQRFCVMLALKYKQGMRNPPSYNDTDETEYVIRAVADITRQSRIYNIEVCSKTVQNPAQRNSINPSQRGPQYDKAELVKHSSGCSDRAGEDIVVTEGAQNCTGY